MDVLDVDVSQLDRPLLAALWVRAVYAADAEMVAACEIEAETRGTTCGALVAASKAPKAKGGDGDYTVAGPRKEGPHDYAGIISQSQKNIREGKSYDTGQATYQTSEHKAYRKGKGKGGGQFTSKENAGKSEPLETTDPDKPRPGAKRLEEDEVPETSPDGAPLKDYDGSGSGMAIYEDGTRFDGKGWRNAKGEALDEHGKVLRKPKPAKKAAAKKTAAKKVAAPKTGGQAFDTGPGGGGGPGGGTAKKPGGGGGASKGGSPAQKAADKAKIDDAKAKSKADAEAERAHEKQFAKDEAGRKAADLAKRENNYGPLEKWSDDRVSDARHDVEFAKTPAERQAATQRLAAAQRNLDLVRIARVRAGKENDARRENEAKAKSEQRQAQADAERKATQAKQYAYVASHYDAWEQDLRDVYQGIEMSDAEWKDLVLRDRMRRMRSLPPEGSP